MVIDLHCDTIQVANDMNFKLDNTQLKVNTKDLLNNLPYVQCFGAFVNPQYNIGNGGFERAEEIINNFYKNYNHEIIQIIKDKSELNLKLLNNKIGSILTIENGSAISRNLKNIDRLYNKGIRMMGTVWNLDNELASGALTNNDTGLTKLGIEYIKKLEVKNIIIDVSHMSKKSFFDTLRITNVPIVASHSCVNSICEHPRNLNDEQLKQIANSGGIVGICFCKPFLTNKSYANINDIVKHIDYIANLVGIDYVGFGSDFDGVDKNDELIDIKGVKDINKIIFKLKSIGYKQEDIEKITSKNFVRVVNKIL